MSPVYATMSLSLDGYGAGPGQTEESPMGDIPGMALHRWMFETPEENTEEQARILAGGAYIMGWNMFGPVRGAWSGDWQGWWGPEPPYHAPVFVLTHHEREPLALGDTTFHFVTDGIHAALERARDAAGERPVHIAGGPATTNQYLRAGLVDELHLQIAPYLLGSGERLFEGVEPQQLELIDIRPVSLTTHVRYRVVR
ncbi:dihydrofolate reductase family protein [Homoserinibacter sp. YIM 151385]|uniref:dihydrofolate reductase family protein n=1 Tax=Homoserinibacter sp. YIM 151385 TaxID=2985506 RepID=UPI0022EFE250|nr:dihydrofolate reductase family protein [Homoserinibacter sp. YIM 151385]WBU37859.1 dihydrofolate reductase family protein [Homoserinibacter sp. YIM 151385]